MIIATWSSDWLRGETYVLWACQSGVTDTERSTFDELSVLITEEVWGQYEGSLQAIYSAEGGKASVHQHQTNEAFKTGFGVSCRHKASGFGSIIYIGNEKAEKWVNNVDTVS